MQYSAMAEERGERREVEERREGGASYTHATQHARRCAARSRCSASGRGGTSRKKSTPSRQHRQASDRLGPAPHAPCASPWACAAHGHDSMWACGVVRAWLARAGAEPPVRSCVSQASPMRLPSACAPRAYHAHTPLHRQRRRRSTRHSTARTIARRGATCRAACHAWSSPNPSCATKEHS